MRENTKQAHIREKAQKNFRFPCATFFLPTGVIYLMVSEMIFGSLENGSESSKC